MNRSSGRHRLRSPSGLDGLVAEMVASGAVSAAVALVGSAAGVETVSAAGTVRQDGRRPVDADSLFDLASLTKPCTATLAVRLDREGRLPLALPLAEVWPSAHAALTERTLEDLLRHRAGLRPWAPLVAFRGGRRAIARRLIDGSLLGARRGTYSDLDFILWGLSAERVTGESLRGLFVDRLDLGRSMSGLRPAPGARPGVVECLLDNEREVELANSQGIRLPRRGAPPVGVPQDGNARFLGGLGGHAGLYGSARGLWALAREWLAPSGLLDTAGVEAALAGPGRFSLGWARRRVRGAAGPLLDRRAFGHTGFTGGSIWIDPVAERVLILLAHRRRVGTPLDAWRRRFHRLVLAPGPGAR